MRVLGSIFAVAVLLLAIAATAKPQQRQMSDSDYVTQTLSAAPKVIA